MKNPPVDLRIISGLFAFDGGSILLFGATGGSEILAINLDWSITSRDLGTPQLTIDGEPIPRGSEVESAWIDRIRSAEYFATGYVPPDWGTNQNPFDPDEKVDRPIIPAEKQDDANESLRGLANSLIKHVLSEAYQHPVPYTPPPTNEEIVRELLREGRRADAIFAYRRGNPSVNIKEAKLTIANLAREYGFEDGLQD